MALTITNIKKVSGKSNLHKVEPRYNGFVVTSGTSERKYFVKLSPVASCTCKWADYHEKGMPVACSHVMSAKRFVSKSDGYSVTFRKIDENTKHLHRKTEVIGNGVKATLRKA